RGRSRTARITRTSNDELTRSARFSSRAIWSIRLSWSSSTVHLTQQLTQAVAGAHDTHLQRRDPNPPEPRHLVIAQIFYVLQQEGFPLSRPELRQCTFDLSPPCAAIGRMLHGRRQECYVVDDERAPAAPAPSPERAAAIHQNAEQPSSE